MHPIAQPDETLAARILPGPLNRALAHVFAKCGDNVALVGGTAIAGFYAGHRRSDDMDLFAKDAVAFRAVVLAIKNLKKLGAKLSEESQTPLYYHALCELDSHCFTADAVLDENVFQIGSFTRVESGILIPNLETLLAMKVATLVSRCSEKDLFDVRWLRAQMPTITLTELLILGQKVDGGVNAENMLASITGTRLREDACNFSVDPKLSKTMIFKAVKAEQLHWIKRLRTYLEDAPPPTIEPLIRAVKKKPSKR